MISSSVSILLLKDLFSLFFILKHACMLEFHDLSF